MVLGQFCRHLVAGIVHPVADPTSKGQEPAFRNQVAVRAHLTAGDPPGQYRVPPFLGVSSHRQPKDPSIGEGEGFGDAGIQADGRALAPCGSGHFLLHEQRDVPVESVEAHRCTLDRARNRPREPRLDPPELWQPHAAAVNLDSLRPAKARGGARLALEARVLAPSLEEVHIGTVQVHERLLEAPARAPVPSMGTSPS